MIPCNIFNNNISNFSIEICWWCCFPSFSNSEIIWSGCIYSSIKCSNKISIDVKLILSRCINQSCIIPLSNIYCLSRNCPISLSFSPNKPLISCSPYCNCWIICIILELLNNWLPLRWNFIKITPQRYCKTSTCRNKRWSSKKSRWISWKIYIIFSISNISIQS